MDSGDKPFANAGGREPQAQPRVRRCRCARCNLGYRQRGLTGRSGIRGVDGKPDHELVRAGCSDPFEYGLGGDNANEAVLHRSGRLGSCDRACAVRSNVCGRRRPDSFGEVTYDCNSDKNRTLDFDREGRNTATGTCFPESPPSSKIALQWVASVLTMNASNLFNAYSPTDFPTPFQDGWIKLLPFQPSSGPVHRLVSTDATPITYYGSPMIGFMANNYVNRTLPVNGINVLSNYSATSPHKYTRVTTP